MMVYILIKFDYVNLNMSKILFELRKCMFFEIGITDTEICGQ